MCMRKYLIWNRSGEIKERSTCMHDVVPSAGVVMHRTMRTEILMQRHLGAPSLPTLYALVLCEAVNPGF